MHDSINTPGIFGDDRSFRLAVHSSDNLVSYYGRVNPAAWVGDKTTTPVNERLSNASISDTSEPVWCIWRLEQNTHCYATQTNGSTVRDEIGKPRWDQIWDDRESLTYR